MRASIREPAFISRHAVIDRLRETRAQGRMPALAEADVDALLEEARLLEIIAAAADELAGFVPEGGRVTPLATLQGALRQWKA